MSVLRRIFTAILVLALLLTLAGCQCDHQWAEADCGNPKTCAKCGETEGEPLGHDWADATCQTPKTCTRCGLTEGETVDHSWETATCEAPETCAMCGLTRGDALGHTWKEANYQDPETCTTCGATQGEPLEADFEKYGLEINLWENKHYNDDGSYYFNDPAGGFPYVTACYNDKTKKTTGALYLCNYRIFQSDETHRAVDGYEWRAFDVEIEFSDENANEYGWSYRGCVENYYAIEDWDNSESDLTGTQWEYLMDAENVDGGWCFNVSFHGETYQVALINEFFSKSGWVGRKYTASRTYYVCVPVGYDGVVIGFYDSGTEWKDGMYIYDVADENTLFFRMDDQVLDLDW